MSYLYTILSLIILSTSVFAMERKEAEDGKNKDYSSYNPRKEFYEQSIPPNKSVKDIPSDSKYTSNKKDPPPAPNPVFETVSAPNTTVVDIPAEKK